MTSLPPRLDPEALYSMLRDIYQREQRNDRIPTDQSLVDVYIVGSATSAKVFVPYESDLDLIAVVDGVSVGSTLGAFDTTVMELKWKQVADASNLPLQTEEGVVDIATVHTSAAAESISDRLVFSLADNQYRQLTRARTETDTGNK